jgi:hypothetical protein
MVRMLAVVSYVYMDKLTIRVVSQAIKETAIIHKIIKLLIVAVYIYVCSCTSDMLAIIDTTYLLIMARTSIATRYIDRMTVVGSQNI